MPMKYTGNIARRYLFSKKHISLISTLTMISIVGVTIGITLLIVVLSVFNGFFSTIKGFLLSYDPDIRIEAEIGTTFLQNDEVYSKIKSIPEVQIISPFVVGQALLTHKGEKNKVVEVKGIDTNIFFQLSDIQDNVVTGDFDVAVRNSKPGLILHDELRKDLNINMYDEVALLSASGMKRALTQITAPRTYKFDARGAYFIEQVSDGAQVYIDLTAAQRLFKAKNEISGLDIKLSHNDHADKVKAQLKEILGSDYKISTWYDLQKPLYDVMYIEKWSSYIILMIIIIVAALNIVGSLTMIVIQKKRDIGVLMSMGYSGNDIKNIFRKQGLYIGLIGCVIGGLMGLGLSWAQLKYGLIKLSSAFIIDAYPIEIRALDVVLVLLGSLILCLLASWYPAHRAAQVQPSEAVRFD